MTMILLGILILLAVDVIFITALVLGSLPLAYYKRAAYAVMKRNFIGYFSNPTGYVFLCLFVMLSSIAAFWPHEFFAANLANLDQLNRYLPFIMLVFIPAITMSIWAEERRQGTDELLLTLPAGDFDIVIGKYLAAAAIFTASLLFSQMSNYAVLVSLTRGDLDIGLFFSTYFGYWMMGLAMLAVGMVASFMTSNLTVGFILGALFNAPLAFAASADVIVPWSRGARAIAQWSVGQQFDDFGRGVISLSSITYFVMLTAIGLYVSMVLIGSRHWSGGRDGHSMFWHYVGRTVSLVVIAAGSTFFFSNYDFIYVDTTEGRVNSLHPDTLRLVKGLEHKVVVDAFISGEVPQDYVETRLNLIAKLKEFRAKSSNKIDVRIHNDLEPFSDEAALAEERFGIRPEEVRVRSRGKLQDTDVILGAAFNCGLQKVVVPFFDYGISPEYEVIRSINTVDQVEKRRKLGIVRTDAQLFGGVSFAGGMPAQLDKQAIVVELEKQYEVEEVDPSQEIDTAKYDAMLVVQPSSLSPEEMNNLITAIENGMPTAIFEDPLPAFEPFRSLVPGTGQPKRSPGGMFGMGQQNLPKADITQLWDVLGINYDRTKAIGGMYQPELVWDRYNPYPKLQVRGIHDEWVFVPGESPQGEELLDAQHPITSGLSELFFPYPGHVEASPDSEFDFDELVMTGSDSGTVDFTDFMRNQGDIRALGFLHKGRAHRVIAAHIQEKKEEKKESKPAGGASAAAAAAAERPINVIYVADVDLMIPAFLRIRARPNEQEEIGWKFENVTFLLNAIDTLSGDTAYISIRKRKPRHSTLKVIEDEVQSQRMKEIKEQAEFNTQYDDAVKKTEEENKKLLAELRELVAEYQAKLDRGEEIDQIKFRDAQTRLGERQAVLLERLERTKQQGLRKRDREIERIQRESDLAIQKLQNKYKFCSLFLPPLTPLLIGLVVFVRRRLREREGISRNRLR